MTEKMNILSHRTTEDGKLEAEVSFQPPHFNDSWITQLTFMVPDNETAVVASVNLFHVNQRDTLHVKCSSFQEKKDTKTQTRILSPWTNSLEIPFRDIKIQVSCSFIFTPGHILIHVQLLHLKLVLNVVLVVKMLIQLL